VDGVAEQVGAVGPGGQHQRQVPGGVPRGAAGGDPGGERLAVGGDRVEPAGGGQRLHGPPGALRAGAAGHEVVPVAGAEPHGGAREERGAVGQQPADVVHVEMGADHQVDILGGDPGARQPGRQLAAQPGVVPQRPDPGVDQHRRPVAVHQEGPDRQVEGAVGPEQRPVAPPVDVAEVAGRQAGHAVGDGHHPQPADLQHQRGSGKARSPARTGARRWFSSGASGHAQRAL
jgi:hypothetical protein